MFFHLPSPCHRRSLTPFLSHHFKIQCSFQHVIIICPLNMAIQSHSTRSDQSIQSIFQIQKTHKFLATSVVNQFDSTNCCYHYFFSFSQNWHFILPQTPCLVPVQHHRSYTTLIHYFYHLKQKLSSTKQLPHIL